MEIPRLDWFEYAVFGVVLVTSAVIGLFFWCYKGGQHTVADYYLASRQMSIFPVAMSLFASFVTSVALLGHPSEVYTHGAQIVFACVAEIIIFIVNVTLFQPVFYRLQLVSLYKYLEMRFDRKVRVLASFLYVINWILFIPLIIYGPALAFRQVSGLSLYVFSPLVCFVCIFYTTVGGLKAVIWADVVQAVVMLGTMIILVVAGLSRAGGISTVFTTAKQGQRLDIFNMNPDPSERLTLWSSIIGMTFIWISDVTNPSTVQRYLSLPSLQAARTAAVLRLCGSVCFFLMCSFTGLIIYTIYSTCDPLSAKKIERPDQIVPYFVMDVAGHLKGLPGLFIAGMVSAALSTVSTAMNTLAGTIYQDLIEPLTGKTSEKRASNIMRLLSLLIGLVATSLVFMVEKLGNIMDVHAAISGVVNGSLFGMFTMGILIPTTNSKGAFYGGLGGAAFMIWTMVGHNLSKSARCIIKKPIAIETCANLTLIHPIPQEICSEMGVWFKVVFPLHKLSAFYFGLLGCTSTILLGLTISYFTGFNKKDKLDQQLLSPAIRHSIKEPANYTMIPLRS